MWNYSQVLFYLGYHPSFIKITEINILTIHIQAFVYKLF